MLDTPPTQSALDFLDAPSRLSRFIDSRALGALIRPGGRLLGHGSSVLFHALRRITGVDVMEDVSEFFAAFADLAQGFRDRAARVEALLSGPATAFLVVTSPRPDVIDEAIFFRRRLEERSMPFAGTVLNRMHVRPDGFDGSVPRAELAELLGPELGGKVARNLEEVSALAARDHESAARLERALGRGSVVTVPDLDHDVHDLAGLAAMNEFLFGKRAAGARRTA